MNPGPAVKKLILLLAFLSHLSIASTCLQDIAFTQSQPATKLRSVPAHCDPNCIYYTAVSPSYALSHQQALLASKSDINIQIFFTALTPSYALPFHRALELAKMDLDILDRQLLFTLLTPAYRHLIQYDDLLEILALHPNIRQTQLYLHMLIIGSGHSKAINTVLSL